MKRFLSVQDYDVQYLVYVCLLLLNAPAKKWMPVIFNLEQSRKDPIPFTNRSSEVQF